MSGFRAYCENLSRVKCGDEVFLDASESRHLCGALRACKGDDVSIFDLSGNSFDCKILEASSKQARVSVVKKSDIKRNAGEIILIQALPKGKTFDDIISSAIQIGASKIIPIISEHTVVRLDKMEAQKKAQKWQAYVIEAMKQSGNLAGLSVSVPIAFCDFVKSASNLCGENSMKFVCSLEREKCKPLLLRLNESKKNSDVVCILIGPEGDFSASEYQAAYEANFEAVSLGENVMKCEVAAAFAMSVASAFLNVKMR